MRLSMLHLSQKTNRAMMKQKYRLRIATLIALLVMAVAGMSAQPHKKGGKGAFSPEKFQAEMEQYIVSHAALTPAESARFFPVYRKMGKKMRMLFDEMRRWRQFTPKSNDACAEAIRRQDEIDIQLKQLQQEYHARFMLILPAKKVMEIIKAEEQFHREAFRKMHK